jgi:hypothetical protein
MQVIFKWIAQFLLIPLIQEWVKNAMKSYKDSVELKRIKAENKLKGEAYEKAPIETAHDEFSRLP